MKVHRNKRLLIASILATLLMVTSSFAADTVLDGGGFVVGINNLTIGTNTYDVVFNDTSFNALFTSLAVLSPTPMFWGDDAGGALAGAAIAAHLNGIQPSPPTSVGPSTATPSNVSIYIPTALSAPADTFMTQGAEYDLKSTLTWKTPHALVNVPASTDHSEGGGYPCHLFNIASNDRH
jgi:hypothetical protein